MRSPNPSAALPQVAWRLFRTVWPEPHIYLSRRDCWYAPVLQTTHCALRTLPLGLYILCRTTVLTPVVGCNFPRQNNGRYTHHSCPSPVSCIAMRRASSTQMLRMSSAGRATSWCMKPHGRVSEPLSVDTTAGPMRCLNKTWAQVGRMRDASV
jgi:hypothetical protein